MENKQKDMMEIICKIIRDILETFLPALYIMWSWNALAPYLGCPSFTYWEIFAMRVCLTSFFIFMGKKIKIKG